MQGRELSVTSRSRNPELPVTVINETGTGLRIPAWMVAPEAAHYHLAAQATLDVQTLRALAALLIPLLDDGFDGGEDGNQGCAAEGYAGRYGDSGSSVRGEGV